VAVTLHDCLLESSESLPAARWARWISGHLS